MIRYSTREELARLLNVNVRNMLKRKLNQIWWFITARCLQCGGWIEEWSDKKAFCIVCDHQS